MMTDLRKAAEQALEVLEQLHGGCTDSDDGTVEAITVWCPEVIEDLRAALAAEQAPDAVSAERDRWETAIGAVMPPDFKDWRENSPSERPAVAAWVISNLREREDALSRLLEKHNALALNAAKLREEVEALRRDAERGEPVAWMHPDGRVVPAETKLAAERDGGAMRSSLSGYAIPLYAAMKDRP